MPRAKRTSKTLEKSARRAAGLYSIDPNLDLGNGLTLSNFSALIEIMRAKETAYNAALSNLDMLYREMLETETKLGDMAEHMLLGVATRFGKSSVQYGMAGGTPKNQRRKGRRGETETPATESINSIAPSNGSTQNGKQASMSLYT